MGFEVCECGGFFFSSGVGESGGFFFLVALVDVSLCRWWLPVLLWQWLLVAVVAAVVVVVVPLLPVLLLLMRGGINILF